MLMADETTITKLTETKLYDLGGALDSNPSQTSPMSVGSLIMVRSRRAQTSPPQHSYGVSKGGGVGAALFLSFLEI